MSLKQVWKFEIRITLDFSAFSDFHENCFDFAKNGGFQFKDISAGRKFPIRTLMEDVIPNITQTSEMVENDIRKILSVLECFDYKNPTQRYQDASFIYWIVILEWSRVVWDPSGRLHVGSCGKKWVPNHDVLTGNIFGKFGWSRIRRKKRAYALKYQRWARGKLLSKNKQLVPSFFDANFRASSIGRKPKLLKSFKAYWFLLFFGGNVKMFLTETKTCVIQYSVFVTAKANGPHLWSLLPRYRTKRSNSQKSLSGMLFC